MKTLITTAGLSLALCCPVLAHEFTGGSYDARTLEYQTGDICDSVRFTETPGDCSGTLGNPDWRVEFATAQARWNSNTDFFSFTTDPGVGASNPGTCDSNDPNSTFFLTDACGFAFGGSTVAIARTFGFADGTSTHSDIIFNSAETWGAFDDDFILHPGETEFRRVAVHELGHTMGLNHPFTTDAIMYFASQTDVIGPQTDDLDGLRTLYGIVTFRTIPDFSGNLEEELVVVRSEDDGTVRVLIKDAASGALLTNMTMDHNPANWTVVDAAMLPDLDGIGGPEIALLQKRISDGRGRIEIKNVNGAENKRLIFLSTGATPRRMVVVDDADNNGREELAVLQVRNSDSRLYVEVNNAFGFPSVNKIFLNPFAYGLDLIAVSDSDGDGAAEVAVLTQRWVDSRYIVDVRNAAGPHNIRRFSVADSLTPISIAEVADLNADTNSEIAILAQRNVDGRTMVQLNESTGELIQKIKFQPGRTPRALAIIEADADDNGIAEAAVLTRRDSDGRAMVEIRNLTGAENPVTVNYNSDRMPFAVLSVMDDIDNDINGIPETAVFLYRMSNGKLVIQQINADNSGSATTVGF